MNATERRRIVARFYRRRMRAKRQQLWALRRAKLAEIAAFLDEIDTANDTESDGYDGFIPPDDRYSPEEDGNWQ